MLTFPCRRCGHARALALSDVLPPCGHCGDASPLPAELRAASAAGRAALLNLPLQARQFEAADAVDDLLVAWNRGGRWTFALVALPLLGAAILSISDGDFHDRKNRLEWGAMVVPLVLYVPFGLLVMHLRKREALRARARLHARLAADGAFACRMCGAPLGVGAAAVVRCVHCQSDNLLDGDESRARATDQLRSFDALESQTLEAVRMRARWSGIVMVLALLAFPAACAGGLVIGVARLQAAGDAERLPVDPSHAYFVAPNRRAGAQPGETCISDARKDNVFLGSEPAEWTPVALPSLVGKRTALGHCAGLGDEHVIARAYRDGFERHRLETDRGVIVDPAYCCVH
jgi:hypothetical protein